MNRIAIEELKCDKIGFRAQQLFQFIDPDQRIVSIGNPIVISNQGVELVEKEQSVCETSRRKNSLPIVPTVFQLVDVSSDGSARTEQSRCVCPCTSVCVRSSPKQHSSSSFPSVSQSLTSMIALIIVPRPGPISTSCTRLLPMVFCSWISHLATNYEED